MAIYFTTATPKKLLASFKNAIDEELVTDWTYDQDGDFTHTSRQWINKAWLHPEYENECLSFFTLPPKSGTITQEIYAEYHCRFIESMMAHCFALFSQGIATALPTQKDNVKAMIRNDRVWNAK
jgi:hypothetical protein